MRTQRRSKNNNMVLCCHYVVDEASEGPHGDRVKNPRFGIRKLEL